MGEEDKPQSWWKTVPGILTTLAAFITAITGLIVTLHQAGMISGVREHYKGTRHALTAPGLISPQDQALLPQPYLGGWQFKWDEAANPREVLQYHLIVSHEASATPLVDIKTETNNYTKEWTRCNNMTDRMLFNWKWKVRVQDKQGWWSPWSEEFSFGVREFNPQLYAEKCPERAKGLTYKPSEAPFKPKEPFPPPAIATAPAISSKTKFRRERLPGDDILFIKPVSQDDCRIVFEVTYFINPAHSDVVWVTGWLSYQGKGVSQKLGKCPKGGGGMTTIQHLGKGTVRLSVALPEDGKADSLEVFLREHSDRSGPIIKKIFPYNWTWK